MDLCNYRRLCAPPERLGEDARLYLKREARQAGANVFTATWAQFDAIQSWGCDRYGVLTMNDQIGRLAYSHVVLDRGDPDGGVAVVCDEQGTWGRDVALAQKAPETNELKAGDVVRLKSGGPQMVVVSAPNTSGRIQCEWISENVRYGYLFLSATLTKAGAIQQLATSRGVVSDAYDANAPVPIEPAVVALKEAHDGLTNLVVNYKMQLSATMVIEKIRGKLAAAIEQEKARAPAT